MKQSPRTFLPRPGEATIINNFVMHIYGYVPYVDFTCCLAGSKTERGYIQIDIIISIYADNNAKEILHIYIYIYELFYILSMTA